MVVAGAMAAANSSSIASAPPGPEDKDALRIEARRQREAERLKKLGPGRLRSIGVRTRSQISHLHVHECGRKADLASVLFSPFA